MHTQHLRASRAFAHAAPRCPTPAACQGMPMLRTGPKISVVIASCLRIWRGISRTVGPTQNPPPFPAAPPAAAHSGVRPSRSTLAPAASAASMAERIRARAARSITGPIHPAVRPGCSCRAFSTTCNASGGSAMPRACRPRRVLGRAHLLNELWLLADRQQHARRHASLARAPGERRDDV